MLQGGHVLTRWNAGFYDVVGRVGANGDGSGARTSMNRQRGSAIELYPQGPYVKALCRTFLDCNSDRRELAVWL